MTSLAKVTSNRLEVWVKIMHVTGYGSGVPKRASILTFPFLIRFVYVSPLNIGAILKEYSAKPPAKSVVVNWFPASFNHFPVD